MTKRSNKRDDHRPETNRAPRPADRTSVYDWWKDEQQPDEEERRQALGEAAEQLAAWGLVMPDVDPLVIHFGLDDFRRTGLIDYSIANETEAGYCGKFLFLSDGQTCPCHRHGTKHETFSVVKGEVRMAASGRQMRMLPGDVLTVQPGEAHAFTGVGNALLLEVSTPSSGGDNTFEDKRIGRDGVV